MTATSRPAFDPVDTSFDPVANSQKDDVESPSLSSSNALARFEFEPGRGKEGTKCLMVEWEDDEVTKAIDGDWEIHWEGKKTVLPARDQTTLPQNGVPVNRLYFLLGPGISVPTSVKLRKGTVEWRTNPLPAIFAPELGVTARQAGKKGVLHTIWAKKRLQVLQRELDAESRTNTEGLGLEMAVAEKDWIENNFGVLSKPTSINLPSRGAMASVTDSFNSPSTPGGGRLMDRLQGLKLGTSGKELNGGLGDVNSLDDAHNPLSPESSDVAVGSFGSFAALKGMPPASGLAAKAAQPSQRQQDRNTSSQRPLGFQTAQHRVPEGMGSLNAFMSGNAGSQPVETDTDGDDDLFALPMSPRSAEDHKSPFSFGVRDTAKYTGERV